MATQTSKLQNLATQWGVPDSPTVIADLVKSSGALQTALVAPATHGNKHRFKMFTSLPAATFRTFGEGIAPKKISDDSAEIDLWALETISVDDEAYVNSFPGGKAGYSNQYLPALVEGFGQSWAKQLFYGGTALADSTKGWKGFHAYAKANGKVVKQKGGASGSCTSIIATNWDAINGCSIRTLPGANLVSIEDKTPNGSVAIVTDTSTGAQIDAYKWKVSAFNALVVPSKKAVAAITQIDATHLPTVDDMNALVSAIHSSGGKKVIYCNLDGFNAIAALKGAKLNMFTESDNYDDQLGFWRGVPIVIDENILSTETSAID